MLESLPVQGALRRNIPDEGAFGIEENLEFHLLSSVREAEELAAKLEEGVEDVQPEVLGLMDLWERVLPGGLAPRSRSSSWRLVRRGPQGARALWRLAQRVRRYLERGAAA